MNKKTSIHVRIISATLIAAFFAQDILWANPEVFECSQASSTLQVPSFFQSIDPARVLETNLRRIAAYEYKPSILQRLMLQDRGVRMELALPADPAEDISCVTTFNGNKQHFKARISPDKSIQIMPEVSSAASAPFDAVPSVSGESVVRHVQDKEFGGSLLRIHNDTGEGVDSKILSTIGRAVSEVHRESMVAEKTAKPADYIHNNCFRLSRHLVNRLPKARSEAIGCADLRKGDHPKGWESPVKESNHWITRFKEGGLCIGIDVTAKRYIRDKSIDAEVFVAKSENILERQLQARYGGGAWQTYRKMRRAASELGKNVITINDARVDLRDLIHKPVKITYLVGSKEQVARGVLEDYSIEFSGSIIYLRINDGVGKDDTAMQLLASPLTPEEVQNWPLSVPIPVGVLAGIMKIGDASIMGTPPDTATSDRSADPYLGKQSGGMLPRETMDAVREHGRDLETAASAGASEAVSPVTQKDMFGQVPQVLPQHKQRLPAKRVPLSDEQILGVLKNVFLADPSELKDKFIPYCGTNSIRFYNGKEVVQAYNFFRRMNSNSALLPDAQKTDSAPNPEQSLSLRELVSGLAGDKLDLQVKSLDKIKSLIGLGQLSLQEKTDLFKWLAPLLSSGSGAPLDMVADAVIALADSEKELKIALDRVSISLGTLLEYLISEPSRRVKTSAVIKDLAILGAFKREKLPFDTMETFSLLIQQHSDKQVRANLSSAWPHIAYQNASSSAQYSTPTVAAPVIAFRPEERRTVAALPVKSDHTVDSIKKGKMPKRNKGAALAADTPKERRRPKGKTQAAKDGIEPSIQPESPTQDFCNSKIITHGRHLITYSASDLGFILKTAKDKSDMDCILRNWIGSGYVIARDRLKGLAVPTIIINATGGAKEPFRYILEGSKSAKNSDLAIIQKKVVPFIEKMRSLSEAGDISKAKLLIDKYKDFVVSMFKRGVLDMDLIYRYYNFGVDPKTGSIVLYDFGDLSDDENDVNDYLESIGISNKYFYDDLNKHAGSEVAEYFAAFPLTADDFYTSDGKCLFGADIKTAGPKTFKVGFPYTEEEMRRLFIDRALSPEPADPYLGKQSGEIHHPGSMEFTEEEGSKLKIALDATPENISTPENLPPEAMDRAQLTANEDEASPDIQIDRVINYIRERLSSVDGKIIRRVHVKKAVKDALLTLYRGGKAYFNIILADKISKLKKLSERLEILRLLFLYQDDGVFTFEGTHVAPILASTRKEAEIKSLVGTLKSLGITEGYHLALILHSSGKRPR
jgi:hypothetical protein